MIRPVSDWGGNIIAFGLTIALNAMATSIPLGGQTPPEISAKYPSLFTPAGFTFSIWGVIYLGLLLFIIYQALPSQRSNASLGRISLLFKVNCLANGAWILAWHLGDAVRNACSRGRSIMSGNIGCDAGGRCVGAQPALNASLTAHTIVLVVALVSLKEYPQLHGRS